MHIKRKNETVQARIPEHKPECGQTRGIQHTEAATHNVVEARLRRDKQWPHPIAGRDVGRGASGQQRAHSAQLIVLAREEEGGASFWRNCAVHSLDHTVRPVRLQDNSGGSK